MNAYTHTQLPAAYRRAQATLRQRYVAPHPVDTDALMTALEGLWAQQRSAWIDQAAAALHTRIPAQHLAHNTEIVWEYVFYVLGYDWERPDSDEPDAADWTAQGIATIRWWYAWQHDDFPTLEYHQAELAVWLADYIRPQLRLF